MKSHVRTIATIIGIVLVSLFVNSHLTTHVFAQNLPPDIDTSTDTSPVGACSGPAKPGDVCHNPPDAADKTVIIGQSRATCWWVENPRTGALEKRCLPGSTYPFHWDLHYKPGPGYERPMYEWFALGLKLAVPWLTPGAIQQEMVNFTNPQFESDMGRACYWDDDTGSWSHMVNNAIAKSKFYIALPWVNSLVQNADILMQQMSLRKRNDQYYEQSTEYVKKAALFECGHRYHGTTSYTEPITAIGEVVFDPYTVDATMVEKDIGIDVKSHVQITNSKRTGKTEQYAAFGPGVLAADLVEAPISQAEKDYYDQTPGFIETFAPKGINYYHPDEINGLVVDNPFIGSFTKNTTTTYLDKLVDNGYKFLCTTLFTSAQMPARCKGVVPPTTTITPTIAPSVTPTQTTTPPPPPSGSPTQTTTPPPPPSGSPTPTPPVPADCEAMFKDIKQMPTGGTGGSPNTEIGYTIPYRNPSCTLPASIADRVATSYGGWGGNGSVGSANILKNFSLVEDKAKQYGWNGIFMMALWIEETGAGSIGNSELGCDNFYNAPTKQWNNPIKSVPHDVCPQLACIAAYAEYDSVADPNNYIQFLCSYLRGEAMRSDTVCPFPVGNDGTTFPSRLQYIYHDLWNKAGAPAGCGDVGPGANNVQ